MSLGVFGQEIIQFFIRIDQTQEPVTNAEGILNIDEPRTHMSRDYLKFIFLLFGKLVKILLFDKSKTNRV